jgi:hypothetical protein
VPRKSKTTNADPEIEAKLRRLAELEEEKAMRDQDTTDDVKLDTYVEVMSLCPYTLTLHTQALGRGDRFEFRKFGEIKRIIYGDLVKVLENYRSFLESGYFYILNPKVVRRHGLDDIYKNILDRDMIMKIVDCDPKSAVKFYEKATKAQKEMIKVMLINRINNGTADLNVVSSISLVAGEDLAKIAGESKQLGEQTIAQ